jgi:adenylosuccinate lyase
VLASDLQKLIAGLDIPAADKARLLAMTPASYIGKAAALAKAAAASA